MAISGISWATQLPMGSSGLQGGDVYTGNHRRALLELVRVALLLDDVSVSVTSCLSYHSRQSGQNPSVSRAHRCGSIL